MERDLAAALSEAADSIADAEGEGLAELIVRASQALAERVAAAALAKLEGRSVQDLKQTISGRAWLLLPDAFRVADLPPTPIDFLPVPGCVATTRAQLAVLGLHHLLGKETIAYGSENNGGLFVNLVVRPGTGRMAEKSTKAMRGHTDAVSFPFPGTTDPDYPRIAPSPDFVTLAGMRNPNDVPTHVMPLNEILARLQADDIAELEKPQFVIQCQDTFRKGTQAILGSQHMLSDASVLHRVDGSLWVRFSHSKVVPDDDNTAAQRARAAFTAACSQVVKPLVIAPGSLLLINNREALHGRSLVGDGHGEDSRWLLRTYALAPDAIPAQSRHRDRAGTLFP